MIRGILFAVFAIFTIGMIVATTYFWVKSNNKDEKKGQKALPRTLAILSLVGVALFATIPGSFHQVETGTVAVVRNLGKIKGTRGPGTYFDFYMVNSYEVYDTKVQQDKITTSAYSKDGQTMVLEVFLQYQIQSENVVKIATEYGNLDALQARIETVTIEKTKAVMSSAEAMTIIQNRSQFSNSVSASVREGISDDYYVNVKDVVLTNIDFTNEFERSVEDKVIAEQEKQAAITRAEAELEVAKLEAQKKIEEARGNAEAQKIIAQASAEAATYNIVELAKTVGYTVNETRKRDYHLSWHQICHRSHQRPRSGSIQGPRRGLSQIPRLSREVEWRTSRCRFRRRCPQHHRAEFLIASKAKRLA